MRKLKLLLVFIVFASSCKKEGSMKVEEVEQKPIVTCGIEVAMARVSPELRKEMKDKASRTAARQAPALLLFLNFDGAIVRQGFPSYSSGGIITSPIVIGTRNCPPPSLSQAQILEVVQMVRDDFSPFNIEVTTDLQVYNNYNPADRQLCIITTIPSVINMPNTTAGVAAWYGAGYRSASDPCFVFGNLFGSNTRSLAGSVSHEVGHTIGLDHQHDYNETCSSYSEYHFGFGTGQLSFAPIMGTASKRINNWFAQPCQPQVDYTFINNHVSVRADDYPNTFGGRMQAPSGTIGILETAGDVDFLWITPHAPKPVFITSENIDLKVTLYNMAGEEVSVHEDPDDTGATIPSAKGVCYLKIEAMSNANMSSQFMTGEYKVVY